MPTNSVFGLGHEIVTSSTRPSAPATGQLVFETDKQNLSWYTGSGWLGLTPAGVISAFPSATLPVGWLLCFGQNVPRATYADLFAAIGTTYSAGDGSTFGLPDLRGVRPAGLDNIGGTAAARLNYTAATSPNTLLGSQYLAAHTHTYSASGTTGNDAPDHAHYWGLASAQGGRDGNDMPARSMYGWDGGFRTGLRANGQYGGATGRPHTHNVVWSVDSGSTGTGGSGNMPPSIVLNYIIKY